MIASPDAPRVGGERGIRDLGWRLGLSAALLAGFAYQTAMWWRTTRDGSQPYQIGDWLVSFAGGLVRRGLFGEVLRRVAPDPGLGLEVVFWVATIAYLTTFMFALAAIWHLTDPGRWTAMLLSPAFLLFASNDFPGAYRKEVLGLLSLVLVLVLTASRSRRAAPALLGATVLLFALAALSHETNALLGPAVILGVLDLRRTGVVGAAAARAASAAVAALTAVGLGLALLFSGTPRTAEVVCDDLLRRGFAPSVCGGTLGFFDRGIGDAVDLVASMLPGASTYVLALGFALIPFHGLGWSRSRRLEVAAVSSAVAPLVVVGIDFGRWIALGVTVATMFALADGMRGLVVPARLPIPILLLFLTAWRLPHFGAGTTVLDGSAIVSLLARGLGSTLGGG